MAKVPNAVKSAENFNRLSRVHERYIQTTDRQTTDGRPTAYSERDIANDRGKKMAVKSSVS